MPGLYLLSDKLADINTLGKVHTGGILRRLRQAEGYFQKLAKDLFDLDKIVVTLRALTSTDTTRLDKVQAVTTQHDEQLQHQGKSLFDLDKTVASMRALTSTDTVRIDAMQTATTRHAEQLQRQGKSLFDLDKEVATLSATSTADTERLDMMQAATTRHAEQLQQQGKSLFDSHAALEALRAVVCVLSATTATKLQSLDGRTQDIRRDMSAAKEALAESIAEGKAMADSVAWLIAQAEFLGGKWRDMSLRVSNHMVEYQSAATDIVALKDSRDSLMTRTIHLEERAQSFAAVDDGHSHALNGDIVLSVWPDHEMLASALNAAPPDSVSAVFQAVLSTHDGHPHLWAEFEPVLEVSVNTDDSDIDAPTLLGEPRFERGTMLVTIGLDTDAGATKTYTAGDEIAVQVQVAADDKWLGHAVAAKTWKVTVV